MAFDLEFKITYDELAPSLQALFKSLQTQITDNRNEINKLDDRVTELENKNDEVFVDGSQGQFVKIDIVNHSLYAHDGFVRLRCVDNDEELQEEMKNIPLTLEEVFNSWYRYAHYNKAATDRLDFTNAPDNVPQGQNLNHTEYNIYTNKQNSGWVFDRNTQTISGTYDGCVTSGFINPTNYYTNYYLTTKVNTGWDDDNLMIIVGYTRDSKGKEHTLSIVRGAGNIGGDDFNNTWLGYGPSNGYHIDCKFWWGLIYDMGNDTQFIIEDKSKETGPSSFFTKETRNAIAYITAIRSDDKFEFRTSRFSADGSDKNYVPEWSIYFQLPESKPESWSQEMYDNIKIMLTQTNRVGFGTRSGQPSFSIEKQISIFDDEDIYALHTDTVYTWVPGEGKWVVKGKVHEILSNRIFIYYARKNYLYFYLFWNSWTKMILDPNKDILDQIQDQIKNIQNNITNIQGNINNINNSITNIEGDITYLSGEGDFLNLAPKIGYYQDDTVEVLSKYNMNYSPEVLGNNLAMFGLTTDSNNREIMYYLANDGGPNANNLYKLYYAYRTNDSSQFVYVNEPLENFISEEENFSSLFSLGNTWMVIKGRTTGKWYLIHTNYSTDTKNWTYEDIDWCLKDNFSNVKLYGCRYFENLDLLTWYEATTTNLTNQNMFRFYVAKLKEKQIKFKQDFKSPNNCMFIYNTSNYSYKSDLSETPNCCTSYTNNAGTSLIDGWQSPGMMYDQENQRLIYYTQDTSLNTFQRSTGRLSRFNGYIKAIYYIPNSIITNFSGNIELLNCTNIDRNLTQLQNSNKGILLSDWSKLYFSAVDIQMQCSYDEINRRNYRVGTGRDINYTKRCYRTNCDDNPLIKTYSQDSSDFMSQGENNTKVISSDNNYYCLQPDSSVYGKRLSFYNMIEMDVWNGYSKINNKVESKRFIVAEYQKIKNFNGSGYIGIEPVASKLFILNNYNSLYTSTGFSTTVLENGDSYYSLTYGSAPNIAVKKYIPNYKLNEEFGYSESIEFEDSLDNYPFESNYRVRVGNYICSLRTMQYNKIGNWYLILIIVDDINAKNESYYKNSYIGIMRRDNKTIKVFDWNYISKFSNNLKSSINWGNSRKLYTVSSWIAQPIFVNKTTVIICYRVVGEQNCYTTTRAILQFNDELNDIISCKDCNNEGMNIGSDGIFESARNFTYSKKYGYAFTVVENYGGSIVGYYTQKPLLSSNEESDRTIYSMEDVIINVNVRCHRYKMFLQSAQGLVCYIPNIPIFLGGYFSVIENPIQVILKANSKNYIYLERDPSNRKNIIATSSTDLTITEGSKQFSKICVACVTTDEANPIDVEYYRINTGYNDYTFQSSYGGGVNEIGDVIYHVFLKEGYVKANGATLQRSDYPELIEYVNKNNLWTNNVNSEPYKYGIGDNTNTFVIPNYMNRFIEGGNVLGIHNAGLPNITGNFKVDDSTWAVFPQGAFYALQTGIQGDVTSSSDSVFMGLLGFDAARSSSVYGASNTVQPNSIILIPQIRYK